MHVFEAQIHILMHEHDVQGLRLDSRIGFGSPTIY